MTPTTPGAVERRVQQRSPEGSRERRDAVASEMPVAPGDSCADGLGCIAFAMRRRCQDPAKFRELDHGIDVALELRETELADQTCRCFLFNRPIAMSQDGPMPDMP